MNKSDRMLAIVLELQRGRFNVRKIWPSCLKQVSEPYTETFRRYVRQEFLWWENPE